VDVLLSVGQADLQHERHVWIDSEREKDFRKEKGGEEYRGKERLEPK
jgi:hypothetical protein